MIGIQDRLTSRNSNWSFSRTLSNILSKTMEGNRKRVRRRIWKLTETFCWQVKFSRSTVVGFSAFCHLLLSCSWHFCAKKASVGRRNFKRFDVGFRLNYALTSLTLRVKAPFRSSIESFSGERKVFSSLRREPSFPQTLLQ